MRTILVVDDSPTIAQFVVGALRPMGYRVEVASDGVEALSLLSNTPVDLIFLDLVMPRLNGYHFCKALEQKKRTSHIPIILMSSVEEGLADRVKQHTQVKEFLPKPLRASDIRALAGQYAPLDRAGGVPDLDLDQVDTQEMEIDDFDGLEHASINADELLRMMRDKIDDAVVSAVATRMEEMLTCRDRAESLGILAEALTTAISDALVNKLISLVRTAGTPSA